jgi:hypothetical protein
VRQETLVRYLGVLLVLTAVFGPAAWPWYLIWGLPLLAASRKGPLFAAMPVVLLVGALLISPSGQLLLPIQAAPEMVAVYAVAAAAAVFLVRNRHRVGGAGERPL